MGEKTMKWTNKRWSTAKKKAIINAVSQVEMQEMLAGLSRYNGASAFLKEKWKL